MCHVLVSMFTKVTFVPCSKSVSYLACQMDYIGCYLTPLGMGSNFLFIELYCYPTYQYVCILIGVTSICVSITISFLSFYQTEAYRSLRMGLSFVCSIPYLVGLMIAVMTTHQGIVPSYYQYLAYGVMWEAMAGFFYVSMFPEIYIPRVFDNWLPSHSIWHWLNFGFDTCMMCFAYKAFTELIQKGMCL